MSIKEIVGIIYVENLIFIVSFSTEGRRDHVSASMGFSPSNQCCFPLVRFLSTSNRSSQCVMIIPQAQSLLLKRSILSSPSLAFSFLHLVARLCCSHSYCPYCHLLLLSLQHPVLSVSPEPATFVLRFCNKVQRPSWIKLRRGGK